MPTKEKKVVHISAEESEILKSWVPQNFRFGCWEHCFYCGQKPDSQDHVIPWSFLHSDVNHTGSSEGIKTPACKNCNSLVSSLLFDSMSERVEYINKIIRKKYRKEIVSETWSADDIEQLKENLKTYIIEKQRQKEIAVSRANWIFTSKFIEIFEQAFKKTEEEYPQNYMLINFMRPSWSWSQQK